MPGDQPQQMSASPNKPSDEMTFEDAMARLEEIVSAMEGERLPLEDMVKAYEEGASLLKTCRTRIEVARQRVELITTRLDEPAATTLTPFDPASAAESALPDEPSRPVATRTPARRTSSSKPASDDDQDIRLF